MFTTHNFFEYSNELVFFSLYVTLKTATLVIQLATGLESRAIHALMSLVFFPLRGICPWKIQLTNDTLKQIVHPQPTRRIIISSQRANAFYLLLFFCTLSLHAYVSRFIPFSVSVLWKVNKTCLTIQLINWFVTLVNCWLKLHSASFTSEWFTDENETRAYININIKYSSFHFASPISSRCIPK